MKRWIFLFLVSLTGIVSGSAAGLILVDEAYWPGPPVVPPPEHRPWPRLAPPRAYPFCPLEMTKLVANVRIDDQIAVTSIEQEFYNPNDRQLEGTFVFPVPKGSQLKKFSMEIDGKLVEAELTLADKARNIYEDIVRKLKDPALLEYAGQDVFKVRIFPIEPRSRKRVSLSYTQLLKADSGLIGYAWSLNSAKFSAKPIPSVGLKIDLQTKRPLKSVYSPSHTVEIRRHGDKKATIGYEARDVRPELGFQLYFATEADDLGVNLMTYKTGSDDGYFLLLASPGVESKGQKVVPKDVVFVLDTSGSMAGKKLDQAKKALLFCVENLNAKDRFEVMRFSTDTESLFGGLSGADKANRRRAEDFINDLKPLGGTAIDDALKKALSLSPGKNSESRIQNPESSIKDPASGIQHPFVIIFLTDGLPTIGNTDENTIVGNVKSRSDGNVRVFCFGIGHDVNTHLLDKITEETRAVSQYVLPEEDIEVKVSGFFAKIKDPVLTNPTLSFTGSIRTSRLYPSPLPDVFQGEQLVLVGRYSGSGSSAATIGGTVDGARRTFSHDVSFPDTASEYDFIPRLWATRRVGYLLEEIRLHGENAELKDEVTELARKYSIVTPYTAYLIVEDEKRREVPMAMQSLPQLQTDTANRDRLGSHYTKLMMERYGLVSVAQSRNELAYKSANVPADAVSTGNTEAQRGLAATAPLSTPTTSTTRGGGRSNGSAPVGRPMVAKDADFTGQTQFVAGRSFYQNNNQWIDASIQKLKDAKRVRVQFGSKEYFDLIATRPETRSWLALGQNVQFALGTTVYEVYN